MSNSTQTSSAEMEYEMPLSATQYNALAVLAIFSACLSVFGSITIICMVCRTRRTRHWTPYTRLLMGMSICDIMLSINLALGTFMRPSETSNRPWASGNDATCSASGFFDQLSLSANMYNGMLSVYFLLSAKYGWKNRRISQRAEPWMHSTSILVPLVTASIVAILGNYSEPEMRLGCGINDDVQKCGEGTGKECQAEALAWAFLGVPRVVIGTAIVINNVLIWTFVRHQATPSSRRTSRRVSDTMERTDPGTLPCTVNDDTSSSQCIDEPDDDILSDRAANPSHGGNQLETDDDRSLSTMMAQKASSRKKRMSVDESHAQTERDQFRRLYLVRSQAFLFVGSYFLCNIWVAITSAMESFVSSVEDEREMVSTYYFVNVIYAIFVPLQGFFNMMVYIRPKYSNNRHQHPKESKLWAFRRAILGESAIVPTLLLKDIRKEAKSVGDDIESPNAISISRMDTRSELEQEKETEEVTSMGKNGALSMQDFQQPRSKADSSLTLSMEEVGVAFEEGETRWEDPQKLTSWVPMQPGKRSRSSQRGSSLEVISELTEMSFVEDCDDDERWAAGPKFAPSSQAPVAIPRRLESVTEPTFEEDDFDRMKAIAPPPPPKCLMDSPMSVPRRKLSPTPSQSECQSAIEPPRSPSASDSPISAPKRKLSPEPSSSPSPPRRKLSPPVSANPAAPSKS